MSYQEFTSKVNFSIDSVTKQKHILNEMNKNKALHWNEMSVIAIDDDALTSTEEANELVLHELIHMANTKLGRTYETEKDKQTEECVAQIGMFKLILVLGLNPAAYADRTLEYIKQFPKADFRKVETDSDKAVEYLVKYVGLEKVA